MHVELHARYRRQSWCRGAPVVEKLLDAVDSTELGVAVDGGGIAKGASEDGAWVIRPTGVMVGCVR